jgi:polyhydroxyalkanoate synthesis repressor PhaR
MPRGRVVIKKYENRRLYDTSRSRYVNLDEIAGLIRKGTDVQVVDAKTGEDLTQATLMQIISENAKGGSLGLPLELLRQLIVVSDHVGKEFIMWYLKSAIEAYEKLQTTLSSGLSEVQAAAISPVDSIRNLLRGALPVQRPQNNEVQELQRRIAELEARLNEPAAGRKKSTKPRR